MSIRLHCGLEPVQLGRRTLCVASPELVPGARRTVPVTPGGELSGGTAAVALWACEQFDGLLWQLVGMARSEQECQAFLHER